MYSVCVWHTVSFYFICVLLFRFDEGFCLLIIYQLFIINLSYNLNCLCLSLFVSAIVLFDNNSESSSSSVVVRNVTSSRTIVTKTTVSRTTDDGGTVTETSTNVQHLNTGQVHVTDSENLVPPADVTRGENETVASLLLVFRENGDCNYSILYLVWIY